MKITGLDFATELKKLVKERVSGLPGGDRSEFVRFLNFAEHSLQIKIAWQNTAVGELSARVVEEPQDYYMRGAFFPADGSAPTGFTLRPGKDYERDLISIVETIAFACVGVSFAINPAAAAPPPPPAPTQSPAAEPSFFNPGEDFPFAPEAEEKPADSPQEGASFFNPSEDFPFAPEVEEKPKDEGFSVEAVVTKPVEESKVEEGVSQEADASAEIAPEPPAEKRKRASKKAVGAE